MSPGATARSWSPYGNVAAIAGLACLATAVTCAVLLVTDFVFSRTARYRGD